MSGPILTLKETRNKFEDNVRTNTYSQRDQEPVRRQCLDQYLLSKRPGTSLKTMSGPILTLKETRNQFEDSVWTNTYSQRDQEPVWRQCLDQYLISKRPGTSLKTMSGPTLTLKVTRNQFEDNVWTNTYSQRDQGPVWRQCLDQYLLSKRPGTSLKTMSGPIITLRNQFEDNVSMDQYLLSKRPGTSLKTMSGPILTLKETRNQFEDNVWTNTYSQRDQEPVWRQCLASLCLASDASLAGSHESWCCIEDRTCCSGGTSQYNSCRL